MVGRIWDKGDCWPMKMGVRAEDLDIDDFFIFFSPIASLLYLVSQEWRGIQGEG